MGSDEIDPRIYRLYDDYCHGRMDRREFLQRAAALGIVGSVSGLAMAEALLPNYAKAQQISFTDERITQTYETYRSPGGNAPDGGMRGYLARPAGDGPFPAVLVVHENRGLNPHIEDVTRRAAVAGFLAFAPDALTPLGGYPGNDDDGRAMQRQLDRGLIMVDMLNAARFLKAHPLSNGRLGATGFCFGGAVVNFLAVEMGAELISGAPFYGTAPEAADVPRIEAELVVHYAEDDPRVNATRAPYQDALTAAGKTFVMHDYPGTRHGFHNNSTPRYDAEAAALAWSRTMALFTRTLA
ncbi:MAG: dienelactone hydrolase family protein [Pseudomonadota bacterium]